MSKTDQQLKQDIENELSMDPSVNAAQIGVTVDKGVVTLLGSVDTWAAKWAAEDATKRVHGVCAVAQDLTVKLTVEHQRSDSEIAAAVQSALKWDVFVPGDVTASVKSGAVTLAGQVSWQFQREAAARAVRFLSGVSVVYNSITLKPDESNAQVKDRVTAALTRQASSSAKAIHVETKGGNVTLSGRVPSWQSARDASAAAWSVPGVMTVVDDMTVATSW